MIDDTLSMNVEPGEPPSGLPFEQVLLVLWVSSGSASRLDSVLADVRESEALRAASLIVVHPAEATDDVDAALRAAPDVRRLLAPEDSARACADIIRAELDQVDTQYLLVTAMPRHARDVSRLVAEARRGFNDLGALASQLRAPVLLPTALTPRQVVIAYVAHAMGRPEAPTGAQMDFLGALTFDAARPVVDGIDPRGRDAEIRVFLNARPDPGMPRPPWRMNVVLYSGSEEVVRSEATELVQRVDRHGVLRWEDLVLRLPLLQAGTGHFRMGLELTGSHPEFHRRRDLPPRQGVIAAARTVQMRAPGSDDVVGRYLLHLTSGRKAAFLTVQAATGQRADRSWRASLLKKDLNFILRSKGHRRMRWWRLIRLLTRPVLGRRRIWLIGERSDTAQDNGMHLFRHLRTQQPQDKVYYIIERDSPHRPRVAGLGHIVEHSSLRHRLLMLHAEVLANAYSIHYMIPSGWAAGDYLRHLAWRVGALRVYLKHGVHLSPNAVERGSQGYDVVLTVTGRETEALRATSGYTGQLAHTGLPRYDALVQTPPSRTILFMSTWRRYLVPKVFGRANADQIAYQGSEYQRFMDQLLGSQRLQHMLLEHDYRLVFVPHYRLADRFAGVPTAGDRISIGDTDHVGLQELIRQCDAFVTDYSSVHFDVAYLGTPIIYARFDEVDFETRHASPSWFDYQKDGFGPVAYTLEQTLDELEALLERGCTQADLYRQRVDAEFTYRDQENCRRAVEAIEQRLDR